MRIINRIKQDELFKGRFDFICIYKCEKKDRFYATDSQYLMWVEDDIFYSRKTKSITELTFQNKEYKR